MQLRDTILTPQRYGEGHFDNEDTFILNKRPHRAHKDTTPAYPRLLKRMPVDHKLPVYPVAFPSRSLTTSVLDAPDKENQRSTAQQVSLRLLPQQQIVGNFNDQGLEDKARSPERPKDDSNPGLEDVPSFHSDRVHSMQTSPERLMADDFGEVEIAWSMLDEGLQLFIYEFVLRQVKYPVRAAVALGLNIQELYNVEHLSNLRKVHPATVNQLWAHCANSDSIYIDPTILGQYMNYMSFAAVCDWRESSSDYQKRLAIRFARQRQISGQAVDALLDDLDGVFVRPEIEANTSSTSEDEEEQEDDGVPEEEDHRSLDHGSHTRHEGEIWDSVCGSINVHNSHDLDAAASHFNCDCLPRCLCKGLLSTPRDTLNAWELWPMYGTQVHRKGTVSDADLTGSGFPPEHNLQLSCMRTLHRIFARVTTPSHDIALLDEALHLCLHTAVNTVHRNRGLRKRLRQKSLIVPEKPMIFTSAAKYVTTSTKQELEHRVLFLEAVQVGSPQQEEVTRLSTTPAGFTLQSVIDGNESLQSPEECSSYRTSSEADTQFRVLPSFALADNGCAFLDHNGSMSQRKEKPRSETLSTDATLPVVAEYIDAGPFELLSGIDYAAELPYNPYATSPPTKTRKGASSTSSFYTAGDGNGDVAMTSPPRVALRGAWREPERPPISPISDWDAMEVDEPRQQLEKSDTYARPQSPRPVSHHGPPWESSLEHDEQLLNARVSIDHSLTEPIGPSQQNTMSVPPSPSTIVGHPVTSKPTLRLYIKPASEPAISKIPSTAADSNVILKPLVSANRIGSIPATNSVLPEPGGQPVLNEGLPTSSNVNHNPVPQANTNTSPKAPSTPPSRSTTASTQLEPIKAQKKRRTEPNPQGRPLASKPILSGSRITSTPITELTSKMLESHDDVGPAASAQFPFESNQPQPKQKSPRKDKGRKRGPYNTKKRKAEEAAAAEAKAASDVV